MGSIEEWKAHAEKPQTAYTSLQAKVRAVLEEVKQERTMNQGIINELEQKLDEMTK